MSPRPGLVSSPIIIIINFIMIMFWDSLSRQTNEFCGHIGNEVVPCSQHKFRLSERPAGNAEKAFPPAPLLRPHRCALYLCGGAPLGPRHPISRKDEE